MKRLQERINEHTKRFTRWRAFKLQYLYSVSFNQTFLMEHSNVKLTNLFLLVEKTMQQDIEDAHNKILKCTDNDVV